MTNLENIKTMAFHFFEAPNKILATDDTLQIFITAEIKNLSFDENFILDDKSFNMLKKLKTNRILKTEGNVLYIKSKEGKYKCNLVDRTKPNLKHDEIIYENKYQLNVLKNASKFVDNATSRPQFNGVLFDDVGCVYGTDTLKIYKYGKNQGTKTFWSVPVNFINLLSDDICCLKFTNNHVIYNGDYNIYSRLYDGSIPDINTIINNIIEENKNNFTFKKVEMLNYYQSDIIDIDINYDNVTFIFRDDINEFKFEIENKNEFNNKLRLGYIHFMTVLSTLGNDVNIWLSAKNTKPIYFDNNEENIILMPMQRFS